MTEFGEQLNAVHEASMADIAKSKALASERFKAGDVEGTVDALTQMMERNKLRNVKPEQLAARMPATSKTVVTTAAKTQAIPSTASNSTLPKGMSMGKTTAIVAGIGLLTAGAVVLYRNTHHRKQQPNSWTQRIEVERAQESSRQR